MNDIVERLMAYDWVSTDNDIWNTLREAADEIKRLRKALASSCDEQRQLYREEANLPCEAAVEAQVLKDEIERLREENKTFRAAQKACEHCDAPTVAEIERLRHKVDWLRDDRDQLITTASKQSVEIERLRADRDSWAQQADDRVNDLQEFIAEIERLRGLLAKIGKQHRKLAGLVRDAQVPFGTNDALGVIKRCIREALGDG